MHCVTEKFSVGQFLVEKNVINTKPPYQRESAVWSPEKQQLFLDSLFNKLDTPKIYLHDLRGKDPRFKFAIIDGKQRLSTIWDFLDNKLQLADDFTVFDDEGRVPPKGGAKFPGLSSDWQEIFKSRGLDVVLVQNADEEDIEEIFSRLNNGEPLSAAEKRNAMGGEMCKLIRTIGDHRFFTERVSFTNKRYQHREAAAKVLLMEKSEMDGSEAIRDLKKRFLDKLVKDNKGMPASVIQGLQKRTDEQLKQVSRVFAKRDPLLAKQAYVPIYYLFIKSIAANYAKKDLYACVKRFLEDFVVMRAKNLELPDDDRDPTLIDFDRLMQQGTNDGSSLRSRLTIMQRYFLLQQPDVSVRDKKRAFTNEERHAIFVLSGKQCAECKKAFGHLSEMHADHELQWAHGGPTKLSNARGLCESCNQEAAKKVA